MERTIVLRVLTRCSNVDQFVATFRRFSTDNAVFVPTSNQRDVGSQAEFSIRLVDGAIALAGVGEICERHATANNAFGKPGILIDIRKLTGDTEPVFERMRAPTPSTDRVPDDVPVAETNKIAASRADAADMLRPTSQTPPLARASDPQIEKIMVAPIPDELDYVLKHAFDAEIEQAAAVEVAADDTAPVEIHSARPMIATTLGVAPLAPATFVSAPFVNDTPVPRWPRASRPDNAARIVASTAPQLAEASSDERPERTAMVPLDRTSGEPRPGPWQAFVATLARSVRGVRWWLRRRRSTQQIRTPTAS